MQAIPALACLRAAGLSAALACAVAVVPAALAHENHDHHAQHGKAAKDPVAPQSVRISPADTALLDQDGRSRRFKTDVLGDRLVVVSFVYTTCTTVCPVTSQTMLQAQARLGERVGKDVGFVTVTVDPVRDTPARLKEYASRVGAGAGWTWLTGAKPQVDEVLKVFGAYTANFLDHPPLVMVGDPKAGRWLRFYGFAAPEQLVNAVAELGAARAKAGSAS